MKRPRREFLKVLGAASTPVPFMGKQSVAAQRTAPISRGRRPNILVFLTDDHAQWLQQAYGNSEVLTPNMTRLARRGVRMTNAFATTPVCSPARASFFTGRMPSQHGIHDWIEEQTQAYAYPWLKGQTLLSELLKNAGYHTGLVGKWHCGGERNPHPGFDFWFSYWVSQYPHLGEQHFSDDGRQVVQNGFQSPLLTGQALRFLRSHYSNRNTGKRPFFLFVGYTDTHSPHADMPATLTAHYASAAFRDIPHETFPPSHGRAVTAASPNSAVERAKLIQYYAAASSIDREVGRILDELQSRGELDHTLVIYTGDHGLNAGHHGMWEKGNGSSPQNFFEESIRVPCTVSWPGGGVTQNLQSDLLLNQCDIFATILDAANAGPLPGTVPSPGRSFLAQLRGTAAAADWRDFIVSEYGNARMIRDGGYKLILRYPYQGVRHPHEFYDLKADPREVINLYAEPEERYKAPIDRMTARLDDFFKTYTVPEYSGLTLETQPMATPASPWLAKS